MCGGGVIYKNGLDGVLVVEALGCSNFGGSMVVVMEWFDILLWIQVCMGSFWWAQYLAGFGGSIRDSGCGQCLRVWPVLGLFQLFSG